MASLLLLPGCGGSGGAAPTRTKWTVLVYMNAANNLQPFATANINQMESIAASSNVRIVVQWKQVQSLTPGASFNGTRRYVIVPDNTPTVKSLVAQNMGTNVDMGSAQTLRDFVNWGRTNFPSDRVCLVIWNHGNGWRRASVDEPITRGVSYDDETGNSIDTKDLAFAVGDTKLDIIAFDASLMQMMEVAYQLRTRADFVVGSQESPPGSGYPYQTVFGAFTANPDAPTRDLTKSFVDAMEAAYGGTLSKITQSAVDTSKLPALATALSNLGGELIAVGGSNASLIQSVRQNAQAYGPNGLRVYRDLVHVCELLEAQFGPSAVSTASAAVRAAAGEAIVWEYSNAQSLNSRGLAIDFSSASGFSSVATEYGQLSLAQDTQWNEWLTVAP